MGVGPKVTLHPEVVTFKVSLRKPLTVAKWAPSESHPTRTEDATAPHKAPCKFNFLTSSIQNKFNLMITFPLATGKSIPRANMPKEVPAAIAVKLVVT